MKWYPDLYVDDSLRGKEHRVKWKINHSMGLPFVYLITLAANPSNLMDVIPATNLKQKAYPRENLTVIGMASTKDDAVNLAVQIVDELYQNTGGFDLAAYLDAKRKAGQI